VHCHLCARTPRCSRGQTHPSAADAPPPSEPTSPDIATTLTLPAVWTWPSPGGWAGLVILGVLGGAGHGLLVMAFARAPASLLAPMSYTQMIWAVLAGYLVFSDMPDLLTLVGMAIIATGGILVVLPDREARP